MLFFFFITLGLELGDTKVYDPSIRALLGTASHYCEAVSGIPTNQRERAPYKGQLEWLKVTFQSFRMICFFGKT